MKIPGGEQNKKPLIALAAVLVIGGSLVAWRWVASGSDAADPAAIARDREMQAAIEREGVSQPVVEEEIEEEQGPPTRAPRQSSGG